MATHGAHTERAEKAAGTRYWLVKTEPTSFSLDDLAAAPGRRTLWDGVRNYQARNLLRDAMAVGDGVLVYHSRVQPMAAMGTARVVGPATVDPTQFAPDDSHFDGDSSPAAPRWWAVPLAYEAHFDRPVTLAAMRGMPELAGMELLRRGSRLSVQPVSAAHWQIICAAGAPRPEPVGRRRRPGT